MTTRSLTSPLPMEAEGARQVLSLVASKWTVPIVRCLVPGSQRPSELMSRLEGISHKVLTQTLRRMQGTGMIDRKTHATVPPRVDYLLTPLGRSLIEPLEALNLWVEERGTSLVAPVAKQKKPGRKGAPRRAGKRKNKRPPSGPV